MWPILHERGFESHPNKQPPTGGFFIEALDDSHPEAEVIGESKL